MMEVVKEVLNMFLAEVVLVLTIIINFILAFVKKEFSYNIFKQFSIFALIVSVACLFFASGDEHYHYFLNNSIVVNVYTFFIKSFILICLLLIMLFSRKTIQIQKDKAPFYCNAIIISTLGAMFLVSSNNLVATFCSLLVTSCGGILIAKYSQNEKITFKYFFISCLALFCYILGSLIFYNIFNETNFEIISENLYLIEYKFEFLLASVFLISALCFQIFAFPFISWKNHICKNLTYPSLTFLSVVPMIAGFSILSRMYVFIFSYFEILKYLLAVISIISVFFGVVLGFQKDNLKEIMTSNTTIQSGIMLLGLSGFSVYSLSAVLFYLFCYCIATIAVGASYTILNKAGLSSFKGIVYKKPYYALSTILCLISLAGLAPSSGFIAKIYLLSAVANSGFISMIFMIISMFLMLGVIMFYFKLASMPFIRNDNSNESYNDDLLAKIILHFCMFIIFIFVIFPEPAIKLCQMIAYYI